MRKMLKIALLSLMTVVYLSGASTVEAEDVYVATENYVITSGEEEGQTFTIDYYVDDTSLWTDNTYYSAEITSVSTKLGVLKIKRYFFYDGVRWCWSYFQNTEPDGYVNYKDFTGNVLDFVLAHYKKG